MALRKIRCPHCRAMFRPKNAALAARDIAIGERDAARDRMAALEFPLFQWREWLPGDVASGPDHALAHAVDAYRAGAAPVSKPATVTQKQANAWRSRMERGEPPVTLLSDILHDLGIVITDPATGGREQT